MKGTLFSVTELNTGKDGRPGVDELGNPCPFAEILVTQDLSAGNLEFLKYRRITYEYF